MRRPGFSTVGSSLFLGAAMVAATVPQSHRLAAWTASLAVAAVLVGLRFRSAATLAVLLTALTLTLSAPPTVLAVASGLCATAYLIQRHTSGSDAAAPTRSTMWAGLSFGLVTAGTAMLAIDVAWLPLIAPLLLVGAFALSVDPYLSKQRPTKQTLHP
ncbi:hypothetical protein BH11ACT7_BH11ACT7_14160 [soil metagenome]